MEKSKKIRNLNKITLIIVPVAIVIFVALMVIASIYDFEIAKTLARFGGLKEYDYYSPNIFGRIFEVIGEIPIYLLSAFACSVIYWNFSKRKVEFISVAARICSIAFGTLMLIYMYYKIFKYLENFGIISGNNDIMNLLGYAALGSITIFCFIYFTRNFKISTLNNLLVWAFIVVFTAILSQVIAQGIKPFANRPRFRTINAISDSSIYRKWYELGKVDEGILETVGKDGFKSFPSGHSAACAMLITLTAIPSLFEKLNNAKYKAIFWVGATLVTLTVMFSRMIMGAHFLSDVLIGCFITVISYYFCSWAVKFVFVKLKYFTPLSEDSGATLTEE